jgi:hypothetical protein
MSVRSGDAADPAVGRRHPAAAFVDAETCATVRIDGRAERLVGRGARSTATYPAEGAGTGASFSVTVAN